MKSSVVIDSELTPVVTFKSGSNMVIRNLNFQNLSIGFLLVTNVTLTGLKVENAAITIVSMTGAVTVSDIKCIMDFPPYPACMTLIVEQVNSKQLNAVTLVANISHFKCHGIHNYSVCIRIEQAVNVRPDAVVLLLHDLDMSGYRIGVHFVGCNPGNTVLRNSTFSANTGYAIVSSSPGSCSDTLFVCENIHIYKSGVGIQLAPQRAQTLVVTLHNVLFIDTLNGIDFSNMQNATVSNSYFEGSTAGAIQVTNSTLCFVGNVTFRDNHITTLSRSVGGAITLFGDSRIWIPEPQNTYILFENNTSDNVGGAIFFSSSDTYVTGHCKIYVEQDYFSSTVFNFSMNAATYGGNAIYGAYLDNSCYAPSGTVIHNIWKLILRVSSFSPSFAEDHSVVSSDVQHLCPCRSGKLQECVPDFITKNVYPGEVFEIHLAALGDMDGFVQWPVYATINGGSLGNELQYTQNTNAERCTDLQYSVLSKEKSCSLIITTQLWQLDFLSVNVRLLDCPLGFSLSIINEGCDCHEYLLLNFKNVTCNITEQTIERQGTTWIGVLEKNTSNLVFSAVCPFLYCRRSSIKIYINQSIILDEDIQCTDNRSGVLCGGCRDSFSLALGSNRCLHGCSNNSLSLIIAFAAAGIALVLFIKILNLTVSQGTINGLIFYANIVGAEQTVLFPSKTYGGFLSVFLAWLNLDLSIETCFFDGMDAYVKAWLQFIFPVYVWAIALFIIVLSHYSIHASELFGNNSVPVLATLTLLSYSKLLRAVISALSITDIHFLNGSTMSVWERDGNIQYLTGKHIPLFVFAVAVLLLLWVPFNLVIISVQWLQKGTYYRVLRWVIKLKPFFDAFTGPFKDKHRYWVGVLLLARCSLLLIFYVYTANGSGVAFFSINFASLIIMAFLATASVYRNYYLTVLELSYILNLGILATGMLYVQYFNINGNQEALVITSIAIIFLQFTAIVIYHACVQLREKSQFIATVINQLKELLKKLKVNVLKMVCQEDAENINGPEREDYEPLDGTLDCEQTLTQQEIGNFREPLLDFLDD